MIARTDFTEGLTQIGIAVRQPADAATLAVYHDVLGSRTDAPEWRSFVAWALAGGRWRWFPKLAEVQDALREFRGEKPLLVEATEAYERALASGSYTAEGGTSWTFRSVLERCGHAAAEAFLAAGGSAGFATTWDESKRRERFCEQYMEAVRESPDAKLLPPGAAMKALPSGGPFTAAEAKQFFARPEAPPKIKRRMVELTDSRAEELSRQAAEITEK